jgi:hypothetical protein
MQSNNSIQWVVGIGTYSGTGVSMELDKRGNCVDCMRIEYARRADSQARAEDAMNEYLEFSGSEAGTEAAFKDADVYSLDEFRAARRAAVVRDDDGHEGEGTRR